MKILLPVAGRSTRYPNTRPKWLLTNPNGNLMIVDSIIGLGLKNITDIYIVYLREHQELFNFKEGLLRNLAKYDLDSKTTFIELANQTAHQVDTIRQGLLKIDSDISFLIKDCDNSFSLSVDVLDKNFVSYCELNNNIINSVASKSYIQLDKMGTITNIVEKKVISNKFCSGAYYFTSSKKFLHHSNIESTDVYVSDVVFNMMLNKEIFIGLESSNYEDWGTLDSWLRYKQTFATLFVDLDGTIFENSSNYCPPFIGTTDPLANNIKCLKQYLETNRVELILTTARPESFREVTEKQLTEIGITYRALIMGLQHSKRIIINDFSETNPYSSCEAINIKRNDDNLKQYLRI